MRARISAACAMACAALLACKASPDRGRAEAHEAGAEATPPVVELAGCASVRRDAARGNVCDVSEARRTLRIWIDAAGEPPPVRWSGRTLSRQVTRVAGGARLTIELPVEAARGAGEIEVAADAARGRSAFRIATGAAPSDARIDEAQALRKQGKLREARAALTNPTAMPAETRARAESLMARIDLAEGRAEDAIAGLRRAIEAHRRDGRASDEALDAFALSHTLVSMGRRYAAAREVLDALGPATAAWDEGRAQLGYYRALLSNDTGDVRAALRELDDCEARTLRLDLGDTLRAARQVRARTLGTVGRSAEAIAILDALVREMPESAPACALADLLTNRGWAELGGLADADAPAAPRPELAAVLGRTVSLYREGCPRPNDVQNAEVNLALLALSTGDVEGAAARLRAARAASAAPLAEAAVWLLEIEARVALARGKAPEARAIYEDLAARARAGYFPEASWQAAAGRGRALLAMGEREPAIAAYREAEAILERQSLLVPLGAGRASFLGDRERSARELVELSMQAGRPADALAAARVARARALRGVQRPDRLASLDRAARARWDEAMARYQEARAALDQEAEGDWRLAASRLEAARERRRALRERAEAALDDMLRVLAERSPQGLAGPRAGELTLAFFPAGGGRFRVFAADAEGIASALVPDPTGAAPEAVAAAILGPFEANLARAQHLRVLAYGPFFQVDVHALPFRGAPLAAAMPVAYALDLPAMDRAERAARTALVVADGRGDLPGALAEAAVVERRLASRYRVDARRGREAQRAAVLDRLAAVDLFHFAGHGVFAGPGGWDSGLELAGNARLGVGDVLSLSRAPSRVVLSGCETGRTPEGGRGVDVSLAHAFLAAGADEVVATARPIADRVAIRLAEALYSEAPAPGGTLAEALQRAQLAARAATPEADWAAYRAIVR